MSLKKISEALHNPITHAKTTKGILPRIFWLLVANYGVSDSEWDNGMYHYVKNRRNVSVQTNSRRAEARNNLHNALTSEAPTWLQILRGFSVLRIVRFRITLETWRGPNERYAKVVVEERLGDIALSGEDEVVKDEQG